jgi:hypothetical protein
MIKRARRRAEFGVTLMLAVGLSTLAACDKPRSIGDANQILVVTPSQLWNSLEEDIKTALEPRTFTVRDERVFDVAHIDPADEGWGNLRMMRQVLLIGPQNEPAIAQALDAHRGEVPAPPTVVQVRNVWAQNQLVTVALLPPDGAANTAQPLLSGVGELYLRQFEEYARARMFVTRPNDELADSLRRNAGFVLVLPQVYRYSQLEPTLFVFRNDQPDPSRLIRNVTVDSRPRGEVELTAAAAGAWRDEIAQRTNQPPQVTEVLPESHSIEVDGRPAVQVQGIWSNPPGEWPAAGPFISRIVDCPDRVFLIDAWLYAPGISKYEYMYQLNTIMDSFECS